MNAIRADVIMMWQYVIIALLIAVAGYFIFRHVASWFKVGTNDVSPHCVNCYLVDSCKKSKKRSRKKVCLAVPVLKDMKRMRKRKNPMM